MIVIISLSGMATSQGDGGSHTVYLPLAGQQSEFGNNPYYGFAWAAAGSSFREYDMWIGGAEWYHKWDVCDGHKTKSEYIQNASCTFALADFDCIDETYSGYIMFLNEPDMTECGMPPINGVLFYEKLLTAFPHALFVGPAMSHEDYLDGHVWLKGFYAELTAKGIDCPYAIDVHTYLQNQSPSLILASTFRALDEFPCSPSRAWVGEFGAQDESTMRMMLNSFAVDARVERIAYFAPRHGIWPIFVDTSTPPTKPYNYTLTKRGQVWVDAIFDN